MNLLTTTSKKTHYTFSGRPRTGFPALITTSRYVCNNTASRLLAPKERLSDAGLTDVLFEVDGRLAVDCSTFDLFTSRRPVVSLFGFPANHRRRYILPTDPRDPVSDLRV